MLTWFAGLLQSPFFNIGVILAFFKLSGVVPWCSGVCQIIASAGLNSGTNCFRGCVWMLSEPVALCGL